MRATAAVACDCCGGVGLHRAGTDAQLLVCSTGKGNESKMDHAPELARRGTRAYKQGTLCATVYRMLTTGPFERPGQEDPIPCINYGLGLLYLLSSLALLGDAIFYAPNRCSPVIADGTRPFSDCSKFLAAFECKATQTCTGTTFVVFGASLPYPYCPTVLPVRVDLSIYTYPESRTLWHYTPRAHQPCQRSRARDAIRLRQSSHNAQAPAAGPRRV